MHTILILGNGFDLSLGLKTSYSNFIASDQFRSCQDNFFAQHIEKQNNIDGWVDAEAELKRYALRFTDLENYSGRQKVVRKQISTSLRDNYGQIKGQLTNYLANVQARTPLHRSDAVDKLFSLLLEDETTVFNFNYTNTFNEVSGWQNQNCVHHIHGSVGDKNIIFGVDDGGDRVANIHEFLYKTSATNYSNRLQAALSNRENANVIIFGHSLGPSDHDYFRSFFMSKLERGEPSNLKLFAYGEDGFKLMMAEIREMIGGKMEQLRRYLEIEFIDTKI